MGGEVFEAFEVGGVGEVLIFELDELKGEEIIAFLVFFLFLLVFPLLLLVEAIPEAILAGYSCG